MAVALQTERMVAGVQVDDCGRIILELAGSLTPDGAGIRPLAEALAAEAQELIAALRYLAEPTGRHVVIRPLAPDGAAGSVLWRLRARSGETVRVLYPRLRDRAGLVAAIEQELWVALAGGPTLDIACPALDLVDTHDPAYVRSVR